MLVNDLTKFFSPIIRYYISINEPNGTIVILEVNNTRNYSFASHGKAIIKLGLKYSDGWLSTDRLEAVVQGPMNGLSLTLDGSTVSPFSTKENLDIEFYVGTPQAYQIKRLVCNPNRVAKSLERSLTVPKINGTRHTLD